MTASDLLSGEGSNEEKSAEEEARDFLLELLVAGRVPASDVLKHAREDGVKERTLRTAKRKLGVKSVREGFGPGSTSYWELPTEQPRSS